MADLAGCAAAPFKTRDGENLPSLYKMSGDKPLLGINDVLSLTSESWVCMHCWTDLADALSADLPPSFDWFTAALIAAVNSGAGTPNWLTNGNAIRQINSTAAAFSLYTPQSPEETQIVVDVRTLPVLPPPGVSW